MTKTELKQFGQELNEEITYYLNDAIEEGFPKKSKEFDFEFKTMKFHVVIYFFIAVFINYTKNGKNTDIGYLNNVFGYIDSVIPDVEKVCFEHEFDNQER